MTLKVSNYLLLEVFGCRSEVSPWNAHWVALTSERPGAKLWRSTRLLLAEIQNFELEVTQRQISLIFRPLKIYLGPIDTGMDGRVALGSLRAMKISVFMNGEFLEVASTGCLLV
jgi:hypothetical protein